MAENSDEVLEREDNWKCSARSKESGCAKSNGMANTDYLGMRYKQFAFKEIHRQAGQNNQTTKINSDDGSI
jgi:hypothetical protein